MLQQIVLEHSDCPEMDRLKALTTSLLDIDPNKRPTIEETLQEI